MLVLVILNLMMAVALPTEKFRNPYKRVTFIILLYSLALSINATGEGIYNGLPEGTYSSNAMNIVFLGILFLNLLIWKSIPQLDTVAIFCRFSVLEGLTMLFVPLFNNLQLVVSVYLLEVSHLLSMYSCMLKQVLLANCYRRMVIAKEKLVFL